jgi:nucleoside-diphosphate-sugar epimerase
MAGTVAITGATGFIGRHLVRSLLAAGYGVRALSRRPEQAALPAGVTVVGGSLEDEAGLAELIEGADAVVHCAGLIKAAAAGDLDRVNAAGTAALAAVCARRTRPPRVIFLSSLAAREPALSGYAASKRQAERELAAHGAALDWAVLRPPAVYGPGDRETLQLFRLMNNRVLPAPRVARARVSLIYVADLCDAVGALLSADLESGSTFEIRDACGSGYSWREIAEAAGRFLGRRVICIPVPKAAMRLIVGVDAGLARVTGRAPTITPEKLNELYHDDWVCRDNRVAELTGWRPRVGLDEGLALTLGWYRKEGWL